ncbi:MAG: hypothetical protein KIT14_09585 [bacterium]|nr:hypothetical protein [bacterium]
MTTRILTAGALVLALGTGALAHVLDPVADKAAIKLRADVAKQQSKYTLCLVKAATKCEARGVVSGVECDLTTGAVAYEPTPGTETAKFQAAIAKCDLKQTLAKKGTDYVGIGCPGDCDPGAPGVQQCSGLPAYEALVEAPDASAVKGQLGLLLTVVDAGCASLGASTSAARIACVKNAVAQLAKYASGVFKCQQKCELDAKGSKGGGATTNGPVCLVGPGAHPVVATCVAKAASKVTIPAAVGVSSVVGAVLNEVTDGLFNREDATDPNSPNGTLSPCGTCGDGVRTGTEACDGADTGICPGACNADCTCAPPPVDPILGGAAGTFCQTAVNPATADFQPLCVPTAGTGRHFRIEGMQNLGNNGYVYLALGFPAAPTGNPATSAGDGRFILTGGKSVSCANGWTYFRYSGVQDPPSASLCANPVFGGYNLAAAEVCVDVSAGVPARTTFWVTGENGANCRDKDSLTLATALYSKSDWAVAEAVGTADHFVKLSSASLATATNVAISSNTVLP